MQAKTIATQPGIYRLAEPDYRAIEAVNFSTLKHVATSPLHYQSVVSRPYTPPTDSQSLGKATHTAILEPAEFAKSYAVWDGPRRAGSVWEQFRADNAGKTIVREKDMETAFRMRDSVARDPDASALIARGQRECAMVWEMFGLLCKGRVDFLNAANVIVDLKTTRDITHAGFARAVANYQYHVQLAFYSDGLATLLDGLKLPDIPAYIIAVENHEPHDVVVYELDDDVLGPGRDAYHRMLERVLDCRANGAWPGHGGGAPVRLRLPAWAVPREEDDLSDLGLEYSDDEESDG